MPRRPGDRGSGVILAVTGSAVGLGNFLRFPGLAAQYEGGAFMIPYFIAFLLLGLPIAWVEWSMGRYGGAGASTLRRASTARSGRAGPPPTSASWRWSSRDDLHVLRLYRGLVPGLFAAIPLRTHGLRHRSGKVPAVLQRLRRRRRRRPGRSPRPARGCSARPSSSWSSASSATSC